MNDRITITLSESELLRLRDGLSVKTEYDSIIKKKLTRALNRKMGVVSRSIEEVADMIIATRRHGMRKSKLWQLQFFRKASDTERREILLELEKEFGIFEQKLPRTPDQRRGPCKTVLIHKEWIHL